MQQASFELARLDVEHPDLDDNGPSLQQRVGRLRQVETPRLLRLWAYYRNAMDTGVPDAGGSGRPYRQAQEWGLPPRITGSANGELARKEVVIENDIAWRIDAAVDFLFGHPIVINSVVADEARRAQIETIVRGVFAHNGGIAFLQKLAVLGAVYGYVDVLVKYVPMGAAGDAVGGSPAGTQELGDGTARPARDATLDERVARTIRFEVVEPTRAVPLLNDLDQSGRTVSAYAQQYTLDRPATKATTASPGRGIPWVDALRGAIARRAPGAMGGGFDAERRAKVDVIELVSATRWQRYEDGRLVEEGVNSLGRVPLVHVQNTAVPFEYAGASDVEPLVPMQDELNTRLSDRAYRITMHSAKMYLGINVDDFATLAISPGRQYVGADADARIVEFGGDSACPSEQAHVDEVREAMDKISGVSPVAAGAIKGRIGRLTSAAALRVTLLALLGRTERKRTTYGPAIAQLCELALAWLDRAGLFATDPSERRVNLYWPNPIPANEQEDLDAAKAKQSLGIDAAQVTRELGY